MQFLRIVSRPLIKPLKTGEVPREWKEANVTPLFKKGCKERDLGLMVSSDPKWATQVEKATKAAKAIKAQIRNSFRYFDADLVRLLYLSLVRPHLEFAVPVWNPYMKKDIEKLEARKT